MRADEIADRTHSRVSAQKQNIERAKLCPGGSTAVSKINRFSRINPTHVHLGMIVEQGRHAF